MAKITSFNCHHPKRSQLVLTMFLVILSALIVFQIKADNTIERQALVDFISSADPNNAFKLLDKAKADYCQWNNVISCDPNGSVIGIFMKDFGLNGTILPDLFSRLSKLRTVKLSRNSFTGSFPDVSTAQSLYTLLLGHNHLSDSIPTALTALPNLTELDLSYNELTGSIPALKPLLLFNVSYNLLTGRIPSAVSAWVNASSLVGNPGLCGSPLGTECSQPRHSLSIAIVIPIVVGIVAAATVIVISLLLFRRKRVKQLKAKGDKNPQMELEIGKNNSPKTPSFVSEKGQFIFLDDSEGTFEMDDLLRAAAEILGEGPVATTYKAGLGDGYDVAVKRLKIVKTWGSREFANHVAAIVRLQHPNILPLTAFYYAEDESLLVYSYQPIGSLFNALHLPGKRHTELDWMSRTRIARGVASALEFIHAAHESDINLHGDVKSSNILLTPQNDPLLSDVGLASFVTACNPSAEAYLSGRLAPECRAGNKKLTQSADIYNFGVLLLELLTGKMPLQSTYTGIQGVDLPRWVTSVVREEWTAEVFDAELAVSMDEEEELLALLKTAMACVSPSPAQRPTMSQVLQTIHLDVQSLHFTSYAHDLSPVRSFDQSPYY